MVFISYPTEIKRVIYTTNAIESVNRIIWEKYDVMFEKKY